MHSTKNKHFIDGLVTTISALFMKIWADSSETLTKRINSLYLFGHNKKLLVKNKKKIISFVLEKFQPLK